MDRSLASSHRLEEGQRWKLDAWRDWSSCRAPWRGRRAEPEAANERLQVEALAPDSALGGGLGMPASPLRPRWWGCCGGCDNGGDSACDGANRWTGRPNRLAAVRCWLRARRRDAAAIVYGVTTDEKWNSVSNEGACAPTGGDGLAWAVAAAGRDRVDGHLAFSASVLAYQIEEGARSASEAAQTVTKTEKDHVEDGTRKRRRDGDDPGQTSCRQPPAHGRRTGARAQARWRRDGVGVKRHTIPWQEERHRPTV